MPQSPVFTLEPPRATWSSGAWLQLALGLAAVGGGTALSGHALDRAWCLDLNAALSAWPQSWSFLTWSALGICSALLLTALSAREPRRVAALVMALILGGLLVHVLKRSLQVERPLAVFGPDHPLFHVIGDRLHKGSMPSGHSATAFAIAGLMVWREQGRPLSRHLWWVWAALQALSRIAVGAHWPSDVLAGSGIGMMLAPLVWRLPPTTWLTTRLDRPAVRGAMAGVLPVWGLGVCLADLGWPLPAWCQLAVMALSVAGAWQWWRSARPRPRSQGMSCA